MYGIIIELLTVNLFCMNIKKLINISRPRFWIYVLGTFLVGVVAAGDPRLYDIHTVTILVGLFFFFTFPANILIYGVNDIYDYETDKHNPKKIEYEELVTPQERPLLLRVIGLFVIPFVLLSVWLPVYAHSMLGMFILTGMYYSAHPVRAKIHPPLDILFSSIIYISPAVIGFFATGNTAISWLAVLGGLLWAMAMQTYSAIPDITADTTAGIKTLATVLGQKGAAWFCVIAYVLATVIGYICIGWVVIPLGLVYVSMVMYSILYPQTSFKVYKKFPLINTVFGCILFWVLVSRFLL